MKKANKMLAFVTATTLMFGSSTLVFAAEDTKTEDVIIVYDGREKAQAKDDKKTETTAATTDKSKTVSEFKDVKLTSKYLYNSKSIEVGTYPAIDGADDLNKRIEMDLLKMIQGEALPETYPAYQAVEGQTSIVQFNQEDDFNVSFKDAENFNQYAKITINIFYYPSSGKLNPEPIILEYYLDKDGMKEITKATFDTALEAMEEAEEETTNPVEEEELIIVPLRAIAEKIGYKIGWNGATKDVTLTKGDVTVEFQNDINKYLVNGEDVSLEVAPTLIDEVMHVPSTLFTKILGYNLALNSDGNFVLSQKDVENAKEVIVTIPKKTAPLEEEPAAE